LNGGLEVALLDDLPREGVAVRVKPARGEGDHVVAGLHAFPADDLRLVDDPDAEAREVVVAVGVHPGHLGGLAAQQRAGGLLAAVDDPLHEVEEHGLVDLAHRDVVEEEERRGAGDDEVVHAHRDEVDADRVVDAELAGELELGPHAVGAGDEHGVLHLLLESRAR
jgi:hypothetical protein